ncbi:hypothetical protein ACFO4E_22680 [Nocardiopsis mangrovi]|uniref:Uncharacterized protein n=1 Tax=Nocardiopsis mangrovi TaxID=1179818 RepID=A0ABV9E0I4_9ACTN
MASAEVTYCHRWNSRRARPGSPITEDEARESDAAGEEYTAIVPLPDRTYPALVTVVGKKSYWSTTFLDAYGRETAKYIFDEREGRLFLHRVFLRTYADDTPGLLLSDAARVEEVRIRPDGYMKRILIDKPKNEKITEEYSDVPVDSNWEPRPEFGAWSSITRFERR